MGLVRSRDGRTYHLPDCSRAGKTQPWLWADDKTPWEISQTYRVGVNECRVCRPLMHLTWDNPEATP